MDLHIDRWGDQGAPVLPGHRSVANGEMTWAQQRPLANRYRLLVLDRRGYYPNPPVELEDFDVAAGDPGVRAFIAGTIDYWTIGPREPEAFLRGFLELAGSSASLPSPLPQPLLQAARLLMAERHPSERRSRSTRCAAPRFPSSWYRAPTARSSTACATRWSRRRRLSVP